MDVVSPGMKCPVGWSHPSPEGYVGTVGFTKGLIGDQMTWVPVPGTGGFSPLPVSPDSAPFLSMC